MFIFGYMVYGCRLEQKKSWPVIVVFSFGAELDFVLRYGWILSVGKNEKHECIYTFNRTHMENIYSCKRFKI